MKGIQISWVTLRRWPPYSYMVKSLLEYSQDRPIDALGSSLTFLRTRSKKETHKFLWNVLKIWSKNSK